VTCVGKREDHGSYRAHYGPNIEPTVEVSPLLTRE
jgi:hypothetical protein